MSDLVLPPDPVTFGGLLAGGGLNIAEVNLDLSQPNPNYVCEGFYSTTPSLALNLPQPMPYLRAFFISDDALADPTLIVRMPDGQWYCGDDSYSTLSPTLNIIGNPSSGIMRVWVGSYSPDEFVRGTLYLTRRDAAPSENGVAGIPTPTLTIADALTPIVLPTAIPLPTSALVQNAAGLDASGTPAYGTASLGAAFVPHMLEAGAGGTIDAAPLGESCVGFVAAQPDYRVQWTGTGSFLRFYFVALGDTTLVISSPDGTWHCNDDSYVSVNPTVDVTNAMAGVYNIWIGSFDEGISVPGTLYITEDPARNPGN
jgi:serine protease Do